MPRRKTSRKSPRGGPIDRLARAIRRTLRWMVVAAVALVLLLIAWIGVYRFVDPPGGLYMWQEWRRLGAIERRWVPMLQIAPVMARAAVAAEDANFCRHWGFDVVAIRSAIEAGGTRGASTISQQVVKNVFLWHGRSWPRKVLEAGITPVMELMWSKERVLEVYLNVAEFDTGVFGIEAAAQHYFNRAAADLTPRQAALLAAILPAPQARSASRPTDRVTRRARAIEDGAATIARDGRAACFGG
ncbi:monofunctional biosynthetic peptidoglycan transglycosylase [Pararhodobacter sp. SW119]|uniref:monofunctional biosynthetic peptidoglycan transglycosylase n=1 Tax=Pararhodobacter sp. SW119 TaxID=2780075 RepID=UPI001AE0BAEE|nr:monofunctional biosynthetic peptidoglycan transglycosylase [Pararhodobacter sp. SW119]